MARTFKPREATTLPRLDAVSAVALSLLLIDAAEAPPLPDAPALPQSVADALADVRVEVAALQLANAALDDKPGVRDADRAEDNAFTLTRDWLAAWARLPKGHPLGDKARALLGRLFADGLDFIRLPVEQERAVAEGKLGVIAAEKLAPELAALGGASILAHLEETHAAYVAAIDAAKVAPPELLLVREKLDALADALQLYVVRVVATVERGKPETQKRADELLRPLLEWDRRNKPAKPAKAPPPDGNG